MNGIYKRFIRWCYSLKRLLKDTLYYSLNLIFIALVIMAISNISYNNIVLIKLIAETWRKNKGTQ